MNGDCDTNCYYNAQQCTSLIGPYIAQSCINHYATSLTIQSTNVAITLGYTNYFELK